MIQPSSLDTNLGQLLEEVNMGKMQLPEFQRNSSVYTRAILKNVDGINEDDLRNRVESHFINYDLLVNDDFDGYFIDRAKKLLGLIEKAMGKPVSDRDAENTIKQFGAALV